jgi:NAD(P)-dependent dehydrogenase (short-subunit alcohol dehydrogenase family)
MGGIRVNCVSPGPFPTEAVQCDKSFVAELEKRVPLGRIADAHGVAGRKWRQALANTPRRA